MLSPEFLEQLPLPLSRIILEMENWTIQDISRRIAAAETVSRTADYQLYRLQSLRTFETDYLARLKALTAALGIESDKIFTEAAELAYVYDKALYEAKGMPFIPLSENRELQQLLYSSTQQFKKEIGTLTNSRAIKMINPYGVARPIPQFYAETLDSVTFQVASGVTSYDEAIKRAVRNMADSGLRVVRYESEGKRPVNRRIEGVARVNVLTAVSQMADEIAWYNIEQLGAEHVVVSAHAGARTGEGFKGHTNWQGRVFALNGFKP